jgi:hypothetical protein
MNTKTSAIEGFSVQVFLTASSGTSRGIYVSPATLHLLWSVEFTGDAGDGARV